MSLTCPFCGEKYFHDRKVCQNCEDSLIQSGLMTSEEDKLEKWNCGIFLDCTSSAFGLPKPDNSQTLLVLEPKFSKFQINQDKEWNCASVNRLRKFRKQKSNHPHIKSNSSLLLKDIKFDKNNHFMYE